MTTKTESIPVESAPAAVNVPVENAHPTAVRAPRKMAFLIPSLTNKNMMTLRIG